MIINVYQDGKLIEKLAAQRPPTLGETYDYCCKQLEVVKVEDDKRPIRVIVEERNKR